MDERLGKGKFATSSGPVNRRTAAPALKTERPAPVVLQRLRARQAKHRLGTPLTQGLAAKLHGSGLGHTTRSAAVLQVVIATLGGTAVFLGAIQEAWGFAATGGGVILAAATWAGLQWRHNAPPVAAGTQAIASWVAVSELENLDAMLEQIAQESEQTTLDQLRLMKDRLSRCLRLLADNPDLAPPEDALFIGETVRRYLPDSIRATLKVGSQERCTQVIDKGMTSIALLHEQLTLLDIELQTREARLATLAGEALLQQQRFLTAKTKSAPPLG